MERKIFLILFSVLFILLIGCSQTGIQVNSQPQQSNPAAVKCEFDKYPEQAENSQHMEKMQTGLQNKLCFLENPLLNKPVKLVYKIKYDRGYGRDYRPVETVAGNATIILPKGFLLINGNPEWKGEIIEKEDKEIEVTVKATEEGYHQVGASVWAQNIGGIGDVIFLNITHDKADFLTPDKWWSKEGAIETAAPPAAPAVK